MLTSCAALRRRRANELAIYLRAPSARQVQHARPPPHSQRPRRLCLLAQSVQAHRLCCPLSNPALMIGLAARRRRRSRALGDASPYAAAAAVARSSLAAARTHPAHHGRCFAHAAHALASPSIRSHAAPFVCAGPFAVAANGTRHTARRQRASSLRVRLYSSLCGLVLVRPVCASAAAACAMQVPCQCHTTVADTIYILALFIR